MDQLEKEIKQLNLQLDEKIRQLQKIQQKATDEQIVKVLKEAFWEIGEAVDEPGFYNFIAENVDIQNNINSKIPGGRIIVNCGWAEIPINDIDELIPFIAKGNLNVSINSVDTLIKEKQSEIENLTKILNAIPQKMLKEKE